MCFTLNKFVCIKDDNNKKKDLLTQPVNRMQNDAQNNAIQLSGIHCVLYNNTMAFIH